MLVAMPMHHTDYFEIGEAPLTPYPPFLELFAAIVTVMAADIPKEYSFTLLSELHPDGGRVRYVHSPWLFKVCTAERTLTCALVHTALRQCRPIGTERAGATRFLLIGAEDYDAIMERACDPTPREMLRSRRLVADLIGRTRCTTRALRSVRSLVRSWSEGESIAHP
jgi:hypothetical protein